ncbi:MAG: carbohydrate ABC transporter permease [Clostridia bacterium]|nr:carbohydrate ABC transporter permease [Clostridia bacterium]
MQFKRPDLYKGADFARRWSVSIMRAIFLISFSYILLYPVFYMFSYALQSPADMRDPTVEWVPKEWFFENFSTAFGTMDYWASLKNTLSMEIVSAFLQTIFCAVYAYGLARFEFRFKNVLMFFLVLTILLPDVMLVLPRLMNFKQLDFLGLLGLFNNLTGIDLRINIVDTPWTFYLPSLFGVGLQGGLLMYIYIQFFKGLPRELEDAAAIDGAGPFKTFLRIIVPSSGVVILTVAVFAVVWHWNDYYLAMMYTSANRPLAVILQDFSSYIVRYVTEISTRDPRAISAAMAACLLFIAPPTIGYIIVQRKFIESIDRVGIVG